MEGRVVGVVDELIRGREAFERSDWTAAHAGLSSLSPESLTGADIVRLASAAYLLGRTGEGVAVLEQAHRARLDAGDVAGAVRCAFWIGFSHINAGDRAVGTGWLARAARVLDENGDDLVERGYVDLPRIVDLALSGDLAGAVALSAEVEAVGRRFRDPDLIAVGMHHRGRASLYLGEVRSGVALMDEAMTWVVSGEVSPVFSGMLYCSMIEACQDVSDLSRAEQWTSALSRWCDTQPDLVPFMGQCAVHRGQIMRVHGAYDLAAEEFTLAVRRYEAGGDRFASGQAHYECGEVHRIRGAYASAEEEFTAASALGFDPQPGLALLRLAQGRTSDALATARRVVGTPLDPVHRSRLLPGAVEVLVSTGATDEAAAAASELEVVAQTCGSPALAAAAGTARARVLLAGGSASEALAHLARAVRVWDDLGDTHALAVARVLTADALTALGDEDSARLELAGARTALSGTGAAPLLDEIARRLHTERPRGLTAREVEVLTLVATGLSNPEIAAHLVLSEKTVARHLSNIFAKLDVTSRTAAAAFAYEHHLV